MPRKTADSDEDSLDLPAPVGKASAKAPSKRRITFEESGSDSSSEGNAAAKKKKVKVSKDADGDKVPSKKAKSAREEPDTAAEMPADKRAKTKASKEVPPPKKEESDDDSESSEPAKVVVRKQKKDTGSEVVSKGDDQVEDESASEEPMVLKKKAAAEEEAPGETTSGFPEEDMTIFVCSLPWACEEEEIKDHFAACGKITRFGMPKHPDGRPRGIAFITYESQAAGAKALKLDGVPFNGRPLIIKVSGAGGKGGGKSAITIGRKGNDSLTVVAKGLPYEATVEVLRKDFEECGEIVDFRMQFREDGKNKGVAFIEYKTRAALEKAIAFDGTDYGGRIIYVRLATDEKKVVDKGKGGEGKGKKGEKGEKGEKGGGKKGKKGDKGGGKSDGKGFGKDKGKDKEKVWEDKAKVGADGCLPTRTTFSDSEDEGGAKECARAPVDDDDDDDEPDDLE